MSEILNAFNNGADHRSEREKMWQSSVDYFKRREHYWKEMYVNMLNADKANKKGIARLKAKLAKVKDTQND